MFACPPKKYWNWITTKAMNKRTTLPNTIVDSVKPRNGETHVFACTASSDFCAAYKNVPARAYANIKMYTSRKIYSGRFSILNNSIRSSKRLAKIGSAEESREAKMAITGKAITIPRTTGQM